MTNLPSGTVTFLFSDIEGSTKLAQEHPAQWEDLREAPIRIRIGIHTGKADLQPSGEYRGYLTLSYVQRLMSAGHGGQILISPATQELVRQELAGDVLVRDMGEHRLKSFIHPEHIYQISAPDLPSEFPALNTLDARRDNLPAQLTPFVGRERELAAVLRLLRNP